MLSPSSPLKNKVLQRMVQPPHPTSHLLFNPPQSGRNPTFLLKLLSPRSPITFLVLQINDPFPILSEFWREPDTSDHFMHPKDLSSVYSHVTFPSRIFSYPFYHSSAFLPHKYPCSTYGLQPSHPTLSLRYLIHAWEVSDLLHNDETQFSISS